MKFVFENFQSEIPLLKISGLKPLIQAGFEVVSPDFLSIRPDDSILRFYLKIDPLIRSGSPARFRTFRIGIPGKL